MAAVFKQDSNTTGTRISEETSFKVANGSAVWHAVEPNSFSEARATFTKVSRTPIFDDRQRKKGTLTDLDATFGFNSDLTQHNHEFMFEGLMRARYQGQTEVASILTATTGTFTAASGLDAFAAGDLIALRGATGSPNEGLVFHVSASAATSVTVDETLVAETLPTGAKLVKVGVQAGAGDIEIDASGSYPLLTSTTLDFTSDLVLDAGMYLWLGGDGAGTFFPGNAANNAAVRVRRVIDANNVELDKASKGVLVTEAPGAATIEIYAGRLLKNRTGANIVHPTYQIERTLGAPDDAQPTQIQSEYFVGAT
jgi:hypothetical protein